MKYSVLSLFVLLSFVQPELRAQSFVDSQNEWYIGDICYSFAGNVSRYIRSYRFSEVDTLVGEHHYKQLLYDNSEGLEVGERAKYYRQEEGKVYMKLDEDTAEVLIYDFDAQLGDTLTVGYTSLDPFYTVNVVVAAIDSVSLLNGEMRKRLQVVSVEEQNIYNYWIEGVGAKNATMNTVYMFWLDCWVDLYCFKVNDETLYEPKQCILGDFSNVDEIASTHFSIQPNPVKNKILITSNTDQKISSLMLYDLNGRLCKSLEGHDLSSLDVSELKAALYLLKIKTEDKLLGVYKVVKM